MTAAACYLHHLMCLHCPYVSRTWQWHADHQRMITLPLAAAVSVPAFGLQRLLPLLHAPPPQQQLQQHYPMTHPQQQALQVL